MSKKRKSASFPDEETKKKMKPDISSSSRSISDVKQEEDGSEEGVIDPIIDPPASAVVDNQGSLSPLMENNPRSLQETEIQNFL